MAVAEYESWNFSFVVGTLQMWHCLEQPNLLLIRAPILETLPAGPRTSPPKPPGYKPWEFLLASRAARARDAAEGSSSPPPQPSAARVMMLAAACRGLFFKGAKAMPEPTDSVKEIYAAFQGGDVQAILKKLDANVQWEFEAPAQISFSGKREGPTEVAGFFESIAKDYKDSNLQITTFVASADVVAAFGRYKATVRATGKPVDSPVAHLFEFREAKVVRFINFLNTAAFLQAPPDPAAVGAPTASSAGQEAFLVKLYSHGAPVVLVHSLIFVLLVVGTIYRVLWPLYAAVAIFTVWDLLWILCSPPDRNAQEILEASARARTYTSYFVAVYGAALGYFLLRMGSNEQAEVFAIVKNAGVPLWLLLAPFVLPAIAMLFFLIRVGRGDGTNLAGKNATAANIAHLFINAWTEKVATFGFVYTVAMIGAYLVHV